MRQEIMSKDSLKRFGPNIAMQNFDQRHSLKFKRIGIVEFLVVLCLKCITRYSNIMADKGLNRFDKCAARCVHVSPQEEECTSSSWGDGKICTCGSIVSQHKFTEHANWNKQNWCYCQNKNFSGTSDTIKHWKTFRIISNEIPISLPILLWRYFSCFQMYSENVLIFTFTSLKYLLKSLCPR